MLTIGSSAPDFRLPLIKDGETFHLKTALEKGPVMVTFVKETCPTCRYALPFLERASRHSGSDSGRLLIVAQEMPWTARKLAQELSLEAELAVDESPYPVSDSYDIAFVPSAFLIGGDGRILRTAESFQRDELSAMTTALAQANGREPQDFVPPGEDVPPFRPG